MTLFPIFCTFFSMILVLCSIAGNPNLCLRDKCKNSNTKFFVSIVASIASVIIIVAVMFHYFAKKKKRTSKGTLHDTQQTMHTML